jgi:hypothetical protein
VSYWVEDANGYVGDIATTFGLRHLRLRGPRALRDFLERGGTVTDDELRQVALACRASDVPAVRRAGRLLATAHAPVMVTDGAQDAPELAEPDQHATALGAMGRTYKEDSELMTTNSLPKLIDTLRPKLGTIAQWAGVSLGLAGVWQQGTYQPKPKDRARLVRAVRKHAKELLALADKVEREGRARSTRRN